MRWWEEEREYICSVAEQALALTSYLYTCNALVKGKHLSYMFLTSNILRLGLDWEEGGGVSTIPTPPPHTSHHQK